MDADPLFENQLQLIFNLASSGAIPAIYPWRDTRIEHSGASASAVEVKLAAVGR